jgi:hypothetical protein
MTTAGWGGGGDSSRLSCEALGGRLSRTQALLDCPARARACGVQFDRAGSESHRHGVRGWGARAGARAVTHGLGGSVG